MSSLIHGSSPPVPRDGAPASAGASVWERLTKELVAATTGATRRFPAYSAALDRLLAVAPTPPSLEVINAWLVPTGWSALAVDGYVTSRLYSQMLSDRVFPIARTIRRLKQVEHSAAPDFVHDVLGHLPMLFVPDCACLIQRWGALSRTSAPSRTDEVVSEALDRLISAKCADEPDPREIARLSAHLKATQADAHALPSRRSRYENFFTWALEYGLLDAADAGPITIVGGAILSSPGELRRLATGAVSLHPFSTGTVDRAVDYTVYQPTMFTARDFTELAAVLESI